VGFGSWLRNEGEGRVGAICDPPVVDERIERGEVGAKGSSKMVSLCARRVFIAGSGESNRQSVAERVGRRGSREVVCRRSVLCSSRRLLNQFAQNWSTSRGFSL
jgi:hypothetical protein